MRAVLRTAGIFAALAALILCTGLAFNGLPPQGKQLPTGLNVSAGSGPNVLLDSTFAGHAAVAKGWLQEYSTPARPAYRNRDGAQGIVYSGHPGDTGLHRKIEIFQAIWHGVQPGQRWRFSIRLQGRISKGYVIVGMEWFSVFKHVAHGVTGYGYHYIAEQDVYPHATATWQRFTAVSPRLPASARCVAVYVQLPEINHLTQIDVRLSGASLILTPGT